MDANDYCRECHNREFTRIEREAVEPASTDPQRERKILYGTPEGERVVFMCPGCERGHGFYIRRRPGDSGPVWKFNGDFERPTFEPSLLVFPTSISPRCHSFVRNGQIEFLSDCTHKLAGKTVPLPKF